MTNKAKTVNVTEVFSGPKPKPPKANNLKSSAAVIVGETSPFTQTPRDKGFERYGLLTAVIINTPMDDPPKLWMSIRADLHRACNLMPGSSEDSPSLRQYHEFVENNELELACDALEESARDRAVGSDFWLALRDATQKMRLEENAARYEKLAANQ